MGMPNTNRRRVPNSNANQPNQSKRDSTANHKFDSNAKKIPFFQKNGEPPT